MSRDYRDYLLDIQEAIDNVFEFTQTLSYDDFYLDKKTQFAVCRCIEIIGEAAKHIPLDLRNRFPEIQWQSMARIRDVIIHNYSGVDLSIIWETVLTDIPLLNKQITTVVKTIGFDTTNLS